MIIVICGPTASGKSALAIKVANAFNGEIINGDAFQVYKELNIGTAKPTKEELSLASHHLFDYVDPSINYSVVEYQKAARHEIDNLLALNKLVVIVGGTGLYQKATLYDYEFKVNKEVDLSDLEDYDNQKLYDYLVSLDAEGAKKIHPNNRKRVLRAISIIRETGEKKSDIENAQNHEPIYKDVYFVGLDMDRDLLYKRINERVDLMFKEGLENEVSNLYKKYPDFENLNAFKGIGYKEFIPYFKGQQTLEETKELIKKNTAHYAKRQFTFFRHQMPTKWCASKDEAFNLIETLVKQNNDII